MRRLHSMPLTVLLSVLLALPAAAPGQSLNARPRKPRMPKDLPMQSILFDAEERAEAAAAARADGQLRVADIQADLQRRGFTVREDAKILVEIIGQPGKAPVALQTIAPHGGEISNAWRHRAEAWVPVRRLTALARALPPGYVIERPQPLGYDAVGGEGAVSINSDSYRDAGRDGTGLTIAVIDGGFQNLTAARNAGDAPPVSRTTQVNYTGNAFESQTQHGTGCVEAAFDHCPGATWRLYMVNSLTDVGTAVDNAQANGVDVITHSLSWYNTGWADNSGDACAAANDAGSSGILFFTSAGNRAQSHYQGTFSDPDGDGWHNFSGSDELMNITTVNASDTYYLSWNTAGGTYDYDFYLYDDNGNEITNSTNGGNTFEQFTYNSPGSQSMRLAVFRDSGGTTQFEIFIHNGPTIDQYGSASGSCTSPSNATNANVIANGAVTVGSHDSPNGTTGIIANYSSQGPSNGGMILPDLTGPTNTNTTAYGGAFGGTSCATPNNAGAACAFWSADTQLSASAIRWLLYEQADLWKDWGAGGNDNVYGRGGTILTDYRANTIWIARSYNNVANARSAPFYTTQAAYDAAVSGGRLLVFPGGSYPEAVNMLGTKNLAVETLENAANIGF